MAVSVPPRPRVSVDGKFFRLGEKKFYVKGVAYGPFRDDEQGKNESDGERQSPRVDVSHRVASPLTAPRRKWGMGET